MRRNVRVSPGALDDLRRLEDFLAEKSPNAALRATISIAEAIDSLCEFSERGAPGERPGSRELFVPFGRAGYFIQYRVDADAVLVFRIFHSLEDRPLA